MAQRKRTVNTDRMRRYIYRTEQLAANARLLRANKEARAHGAHCAICRDSEFLASLHRYLTQVSNALAPFRDG